jgi:hypothetical protein
MFGAVGLEDCATEVPEAGSAEDPSSFAKIGEYVPV